ncbi:hypothetical protein [Lacticaseibacillus paracasei]|nr:hypothetical protein [Lacticaseibacillus paracasei]
MALLGATIIGVLGYLKLRQPKKDK